MRRDDVRVYRSLHYVQQPAGGLWFSSDWCWRMGHRCEKVARWLLAGRPVSRRTLGYIAELQRAHLVFADAFLSASANEERQRGGAR